MWKPPKVEVGRASVEKGAGDATYTVPTSPHWAKSRSLFSVHPSNLFAFAVGQGVLVANSPSSSIWFGFLTANVLICLG